jgi:sulfite reductase alpha subunit-like flavoprotein
MENDDKKIYILYGSATGNGESIAEILAENIYKDFKYEPYCGTLNSIKNDISELNKKCRFLIIICSTTGNGDPPENASIFWNIIKKRSLSKTLLNNIPFIVLGLGDTNYDKFCHMGKSIDKRLKEIGGKQYLELECADESNNFEEMIETWNEKILSILKNNIFYI